jgi:hypothetical protein
MTTNFNKRKEEKKMINKIDTYSKEKVVQEISKDLIGFVKKYFPDVTDSQILDTSANVWIERLVANGKITINEFNHMAAESHKVQILGPFRNEKVEGDFDEIKDFTIMEKPIIELTSRGVGHDGIGIYFRTLGVSITDLLLLGDGEVISTKDLPVTDKCNMGFLLTQYERLIIAQKTPGRIYCIIETHTVNQKDEKDNKTRTTRIFVGLSENIAKKYLNE